MIDSKEYIAALDRGRKAKPKIAKELTIPNAYVKLYVAKVGDKWYYGYNFQLYISETKAVGGGVGSYWLPEFKGNTGCPDKESAIEKGYEALKRHLIGYLTEDVPQTTLQLLKNFFGITNFTGVLQILTAKF